VIGLEGILLKREGGKIRLLPVKGLAEKVIVVAINYTNAKIAQKLREQGVPLVEDETPQESKMRSEIKIANFALTHGGGAKVYPAHHQKDGIPYLISDTGRSIFQEQGVKISASQVINEILALEERRVFLQTYRGVTQMGLQRKKPPKFKTKIWLWPRLIDKKPKAKGFLEITDKPLPNAYQELINAVFFVGGIFENFDPQGIAIELTGRQPDGQSNYSLQFRLEKS